MATKKITLNELRILVKQIIKEESEYTPINGFNINKNKLIKPNNLTESEYQSVVDLTPKKLMESDRDDYIFTTNINAEFYSGLKEHLMLESLGSGILSVLGSVKDFLTGIGVVKTLLEKIKKFANKFISGSKAEVVWEKGVKLIKWLYKYLGIEGITYLLALGKFKTKKPTDDQKATLRDDAAKIWAGILSVLVVSFVIKMLAFGGISFVVKLFDGQIEATLGTFASVLGTSLLPKAFGIFSAYKKTKDLKKTISDFERLKKEEEDALNRMSNI